MNPSRIYPLRNPCKQKDWGSRQAIPGFLGEPAAEAPLGELWMGAYPGASSMLIDDDGREVGLDAAIADDPANWLGGDGAARSGELPFLFKILAADSALSIQAHPSQAQARAGFEREETAGVPRNAKHRNYRDPHHKPELICALTPFTALVRFRAQAQIARAFEALEPGPLAERVAALREDPGQGSLRAFFEALMALPDREAGRLVEHAAVHAEEPEVRGWVAKLAKQHPGDRGALAPLYLNLVTLEPGQALFLEAQELHSYLDGLAVELMANSDNVLRGGLTQSHVDVDELLATLSYEQGGVELAATTELSGGWLRYESPAEEFALRRAEVQGRFEAETGGRLEILLCTRGSGQIECDGGRALPLRRGVALVCPAAVKGYCLQGDLEVYTARAGAGAA